MLHAKLVREGFKVNVNVIERLYREEASSAARPDGYARLPTH